jgi:hypothetical protein
LKAAMASFKRSWPKAELFMTGKTDPNVSVSWKAWIERAEEDYLLASRFSSYSRSGGSGISMRASRDYFANK